MFDGLKYLWEEPSEIERTLFAQQTGEHCCPYTIPAGEQLAPNGKVEEAKLCQICFEREIEWPVGFGNADSREEEAAFRDERLRWRRFSRDG